MGESQLFQFVLSANGAGRAGGLGRADDDHGLEPATSSTRSTAAAGDTVSGHALFLTPGAYTIHFTVLGAAGGGVPPLSYNLLGEGISDPIGPVPDDPTLTPVYNIPTMPGFFGYPDGTITTDPFLITLMMPPPPSP